MSTLPVTVDQTVHFILIFVRVVSMLALMPIFGAQNVPAQVKVGFSLVLALILMPFISGVDALSSVAFSLPLFGLMVIKEVMVGVGVGLIASMLFTAVQFAGRLVDTEMGFGFVELADPFSDDMVTVWGQLQVIVFTIIFLLFNGHYFMLLALQRSFELVPLLGATLPDGKVALHLITITGSLFEISIKFAAPVYVPLVLSEIALGAVARTVPQINIFFVGMPLKIVIGLCTAVLVLPMLTGLFRSYVEKLVQDIWRLLYLMA